MNVNADKKELIRSTNDDALQSKLSAISTGYLVEDKDGLTKLIAGRGASKLLTKRQPIINRGSYARTTGIDRIVKEFISWSDSSDSRSCQIISLGAGSDSRYFELKVRQ